MAQKSNKVRVPFVPAGSEIRKSTSAAAIAEKLSLNEDITTVSADLLDPEVQRRIAENAKNVDPKSYFDTGSQNPAKIKTPLTPPWDGLSTRKKVKAFNLHPSLNVKARLEYLSERTGVSQHEICMENLEGIIIKLSDAEFEKERKNRS